MRSPVDIRRWVRLLAFGALAVALLPAAQAGGREAPVLLTEPQALDWLTRINAAANDSSYRGTMVFSADGVMSSSKVAHLCIGDQFFERVEALDGRQHRVYRHNELVHTVWPQERVVVVERRKASSGLISTRRAVEPRALERYAVRSLGTRRIAGRSARVLLLEPRDDLRFAQRLWADEATGLLLRTDVLASDGRVLESAAFSDIELGVVQGAPPAVLEGMTPSGYRVEQSPYVTVDLRSLGWVQRFEVPGFRLTDSLKRPLQGGRGDLLQAVFSDGLTFVSVFIEPFDERQHPRALSAAMGATRTVMQRHGEHWVTTLGDVPRVTLEHFVRAIERQR